MKLQVRLFMVISLTVIFCCACKDLTEKPEAINRTGVNLTEADISAEMMEIEEHPLWGYSAEGGEIARYRGSSGKVTRYRMIYYGETGRAEENYYFFGDDIYFTRLVENYRFPINVDIPTEVLNREYEQGALMDGVCYLYDDEEGLSHSDTITIPYSSRRELDDVFERAAAEEMMERLFSDYRILAIDGFLLGGCYHGRWIEWEELYPMIPEEDIYKFYVNGQYKGEGSGRKVPETNVELYSGPWINFQDSNYGFDEYQTVVAYSGPEDLQIESGTAISLGNEIYRNELQKYLLEMGLTGAFELTNIVKIDLDDDGQDEVFIQAYRQEDSLHEAMGIHYMRKVVDGKAESFLIPIMNPIVPADHLTMIGFSDLNGDGSKELLMSAMGIGYHSYLVYEFHNDGFIRIFENGGEH